MAQIHFNKKWDYCPFGSFYSAGCRAHNGWEKLRTKGERKKGVAMLARAAIVPVPFVGNGIAIGIDFSKWIAQAIKNFCHKKSVEEIDSLFSDRMDEFKKKALEHFEAITAQGPQYSEGKPFNFSQESLEKLQEVITYLAENYEFPESVSILGQNQASVFQIPEIPGIVFKLPHNRDEWQSKDDSFVDERIEATEKTREVCKENNLYLLHVPRQEIVECELPDSSKIQLLAEEKFEILPDEYAVYEFCMQDKEMRSYMIECTQQLFILIFATGHEDFRCDNEPFLSNGIGIGLVDMDLGKSPLVGLKGGCAKGGGLLNTLSPKLINKLKSTMEEKLSQEQLQRLEIDQIKEERRKYFDQHNKFAQFLNEKGISYNTPFGARVKVNREFKSKFKKLKKSINESINDQKSNSGMSLIPCRKHVLSNVFFKSNEQLLNELKNKGHICHFENYQGKIIVWC